MFLNTQKKIKTILAQGITIWLLGFPLMILFIGIVGIFFLGQPDFDSVAFAISKILFVNFWDFSKASDGLLLGFVFFFVWIFFAGSLYSYVYSGIWKVLSYFF